MPAKARKIKIRVRKGRFILVLPAFRFQFLKRVLHFGLRFVPKDKILSGQQAENAYSVASTDPSRERRFHYEEVDWEGLTKDLDFLLEELARLEPFVLVEVKEETENVYVKIETI
jgi:hypothetical protein